MMRRKELNNPIERKDIFQKAGFNYVKAHYVISKANRIFNYDWDSKILELRIVKEEKVKVKNRQGIDKDMWCVSYLCICEITADGTTRSDVGTGISYHQYCSEAHGNAIKSAETDALKRAFRTWGPSLGLALYDDEGKGITNNSMNQCLTISDKEILALRRLIGLSGVDDIDMFEKKFCCIFSVHDFYEIEQKDYSSFYGKIEAWSKETKERNNDEDK